MKNSIIIICTLLFGAFASIAQGNPGIAAGFPAVNGLHATPEIASKLIRLELIKLDKYSVYDEYDMKDAISNDPSLGKDCLSKDCLIRLGKELKVDYMISGSVDAFGNKIIVSLKMIDIKNESIYKTKMKEFTNQEVELQRMIEIVLKEMHEIEVDPLLVDRLEFDNDPVTKSSVGKINNSGPRIGFGMMTGDFREFATRSEARGGLDIFPGVSMIGYQFEGQYVGTENFSALIEGIVNISGLEQGRFIPSISIMNGFRFGRAGWEFAFGPGFGLSQESKGFFDTEGLFGEKGTYFNEDDWKKYVEDTYGDPNEYPEFHPNGTFEAPAVEEFNPDYNFNSYYFDTRGSVRLNTMFVFAVGRTFRAGALNIPVNLFYTSRRGGGLAGVNIGFNVMKSKTSANGTKL